MKKWTEKKWIAAFTLCTVLLLITAACGKDSTAIPNPFIECQTLDEAAGLAGFTLTVPDTIDGYASRQIFAIEKELIEVTYTNDAENHSDGRDFCIRKGTESAEIVSGDYNDYPEINTISVDTIQVTTKGENGTVSVAFWTNAGYSFAVLAGNPLTADDLQEIITNIK